VGSAPWLDSSGGLTGAGRDARERIEANTDRTQDALVTALGTALDDVVEAANGPSGRVLAARTAPSDPRKRAAG
jgi:hypothetical protein